MSEILARLGTDEIFALIMLLSSAVVGMSVFFTVQWRKLRQTELDAALKQDMLNRGMSARDIKLVLESAGARDAQKEPAPQPESPTEPFAEVVHLARAIEDKVLTNVKHVLVKVAGRL